MGFVGFEKEKETNRGRGIRRRTGREGGWRAEDEKLNQRGKGLRGYFPTLLLPTGKINITLETLLFFCWGPGGPQGIPRLLPRREGERLENWRGKNILWPRRRLTESPKELKSNDLVPVRAKRGFLKLLYSTLFYLPPLRYPGTVTCWDRIQCCHFSFFSTSPCSGLRTPGEPESGMHSTLTICSYITYW